MKLGYCFVVSLGMLMHKESRCQWFETLRWSCDFTVMSYDTTLNNLYRNSIILIELQYVRHTLVPNI